MVDPVTIYTFFLDFNQVFENNICENNIYLVLDLVSSCENPTIKKKIKHICLCLSFNINNAFTVLVTHSAMSGLSIHTINIYVSTYLYDTIDL